MAKTSWFQWRNTGRARRQIRRPSSSNLRVDRLEDRTAPAAGNLIVTAAGATGGPHIKVFDAGTGALKYQFLAYDPSFVGGVRVATADVTGDGIPDIITGPGPGGGPDIRVFDGSTHLLVREFNAFDPAFRGGVMVAAGDFTGDGKADIVVTPDAGGGPIVRVFNGATGAMVRQFNAYDPNFRGGVNLAVGNVTGDGVPDIITAPGVGGGPDVRVFNGTTGQLVREFNAYDPAFRGGVFVAATVPPIAGGAAGRIVTGAGAGGGPHVKVFDVSSSLNPVMTASFLPFPTTFVGGVRVASADVAGNGQADIVIVPGRDNGASPGVGPRFVVTTMAGVAVRSVAVYDPSFSGGLYAAGTVLEVPSGTPHATFTAPTANEGGSGQVSFGNVGGGSGGYLFSYDFDNNGTFEITDSTSPTAAVPASYLSDGPGAITLHGRIKDSSGASTNYTTTVTIQNVPPTVRLTGPFSGDPNAPINFLATVTDPSPVDTAAGFTYTWNFGDGSATSTLAAPSHSYSTAATYTVSVTVRDKDGGTTTTTASVIVGTPSFIVTAFDRIPNFGANPTISAVTSGNWSSAATWTGGRLPVAGDVVSIPANMTVTYDQVSDLALNTVAIQAGGSLVFRTDINTRLTVVNLLVMDGGLLQIGTVANPVAAIVKAEVVFADQPFNLAQDPEQYGHGLIALGTVTMCGANKGDTFVRLAAEPRAGDTTLTLSAPEPSWQVGDRLVLPDTRQLIEGEYWSNYSPQWEVLTILAISADGRTLTLSSPLQFDHLGARDPSGTLDFLPHVANLSRNVVVHSQSATGTRGYTLFTQRAVVDIRYTQFAGLGRTTKADVDSTTFDSNGNVTHVGVNQAGRYSVYFQHLMGPTTLPADGFQFTFADNSVFCPLNPMPFRWGITLDDSHYGLLSDNVVYNWAGAGIVGESGNESYNVIQHNFVVAIRGDSNPRINDGLDGSAFWFNDFNNYFRDNVATDAVGTSQGIVAGSGYNLYAPAGSQLNTAIPSFPGADLTISGQYQLMNRSLTPLLQFARNEVYGACATGLTLWHLATDGYSVSNVAQSVVQDFVAWHVWEDGFFAYPIQNVLFDGFTVIGDSRALGNLNGGYGWRSGDYWSGSTTIQRANIQGMNWGIANSTDTHGVFTIRDSYFRNYISDIGVQSLATPGSRATTTARQTVIDNDRFDPYPGAPSFTAISMDYYVWAGGNNFITSDQVFVYNYNGVAGDNFQVYYLEQDPSFIVPQTTYYGPNNSLLDSLGSPVAGLTNAQNWATYGIAIAGAVTPTTATRSGIHGYVRAI